MKKILLFITSFLLVFVTFTYSVKADNVATKGMIPKQEPTMLAKAPQTFPNENDTLYAVLDDTFDYSKISFETAVAGEEAITGNTYMRKIMLSMNPNPEGTTKEELLNNNYFSAYCLDASLHFPYLGLANLDGYDELEDNLKVQHIALAKLLNDLNYSKLFEKAKGAIAEPIVTYELADGETDASVLQKFEAGTEISIYVKNIRYVMTAAPTYFDITAKDLAKNDSATKFEVKVKKNDVLFDNYYAKNITNTNYNHALWILEHSYPTLDINSTLLAAGSSYNSLLAEVKTLHEGETRTDEEWSNLTENYVYSTIQYAIWKVNDGFDRNGKKLGNQLIGSVELNKLYKYLIQDREEYKDYDKYEFSDDIKLNKPDSKNEIYKETDDSFVYGPYSADYDLVSIKDVKVALKEPVEGVSIVDENDNLLTTIEPTQKFYIKCLKKAKIANVQIVLSTDNALTFSPSTNRGKIYSPYSPLTQNVVTGGKIVNKNIEKTIDVLFNPKTGVENIVLLFAVTLIAFLLGYFALNFKTKPLDLD